MRFQSFILSALTLVSVSTHASRSEMVNVESDGLTRAFTATKGIYKFMDAAKFTPKEEFIQGKRIISPDRETISYNANEPVFVEFLPNGDAKITALLTDEEKGKIPESIIIDGDSFNRSGLRMIQYGSLEDLQRKYSPYEEIKEARRNGGASRARGRMHVRAPGGGSYAGCVAYVCTAIGGCSGTTGNGVGMTRYLRNKGWKTGSCSNPSVGTVASWRGGSGSGHTAIWNGHGWCYDLGCADPGSRYRIFDCVVKN